MISFGRVFKCVKIVAALAALGLACNAQDSLDVLTVETRTLVELFEQAHYNRGNIRPADYEKVIRAFASELDGERLIFLQSDVDRLTAKYAANIYSSLRTKGDISAAREIYSVYAQRFQERLQAIPSDLGNAFDFTTDEYYEPNRLDAAWPETSAAAEELWRKRLKAQVLVGILEGKSAEAATKIVLQRYARGREIITATDTDEIAELFLTCVAQLFDPHSRYVSGSGRTAFNPATNEHTGIGVEITKMRGRWMITDVIPGSSAAADGLRAGDEILAIGEQDSAQIDSSLLTARSLVQLISGKTGSNVVLLIHSANENGAARTRTVSVARAVNDPALSRASAVVATLGSSKAKSYGIISLPSLYGPIPDRSHTTTSAVDDVSSLLKKLGASKVDGVILDLRGNGGGYLTEAVDLVGLCGVRGPVVQLKNYRGEIEVERSKQKSSYAGPLVVVVDGETASGAEIVAGAIQNYGRGLVVGSARTNGSGTIQTVLEMKHLVPALATQNKPTGLAKFTVQQFYLPNGISTQLLGITPDLAIFPNQAVSVRNESEVPNALPSDRIPSLKIKGKPIDASQLEHMRALSTERQHKRREHRSTRAIAESNPVTDGRVSLSLERRRAQLQDISEVERTSAPVPQRLVSDLKIVANHRPQPRAGADNQSQLPRIDPLLEEALLILNDWAALGKR